MPIADSEVPNITVPPSHRVAIIGAGMAGMACAQALQAAGHNVHLFDKGRGPGGRMSSRRVAIDGLEVGFDHGAQFFTARDAEFRQQVLTWQKSGVVAPWPSAGSDAWVGTPAMNAPIADMATRLPVSFGGRVERLVRHGATWQLVGEVTPEDRFDAVVVAVPAEQVSALIVQHSPGFAQVARATPSQPCWTLMVAFAERVSCDSDILRSDGDIIWAARNSSKPGRTPLETWVIQASPEWSGSHRGASPADVVALLSQAFTTLLGQDLPEAIFVQAHSWLYARSGSNGTGYLWDPTIGLGACGDWLVGPRVECAWLSGNTLAKAMTQAAQTKPEHLAT